MGGKTGSIKITKWIRGKWEETASRVKFSLVLAISFVTTVTITLVGLANLHSLSKRIDYLTNVTAQKMQIGLELKRAMVEVDRYESELFTSSDLKKIQDQEKKMLQANREIFNYISQLSQVQFEIDPGKIRAISKQFSLYLELQKHTLELLKIDHRLRANINEVNSFPSFKSVQKRVRNASQFCSESIEKQTQVYQIACLHLIDEIVDRIESLMAQNINVVFQYKVRRDNDFVYEIPKFIHSLHAKTLELTSILNEREKKIFKSFSDSLERWLTHQALTDMPSIIRSEEEILKIRQIRRAHLLHEIEGVVTEIVAKNKDEFKKQQNDSQIIYQKSSLLLGLLSFACILLATGVGYSILSGIRRNLQKIDQAAMQLSKGQLEARVSIKSRDELGQLGEAFNKMAARIERSTSAQEEAKRLAESANHAKTEFLANMSHEIRTPINAIIGLLEMFQTTSVTEKQRAFLKQMRHSSDLLLMIINDILDLSKIDVGAIELENTAFDIHSVAEEIIDLFKVNASEKSIDLRLRIAPNVPRLALGDSMRISQVLMNLISNAVRFTKKGYVCLAIKKEEKGLISFSVEDTGIGISEAQLQKIFKPFTQANPSTTREFGGTGLGLAICERLVQAMGGEVGVTSCVNKGSVFHMTLPLKETKNPIPKLVEPTTKPEKKRVLSQIEVLLADDNKINRDVAKMMLEHLGCRVTLASNGLEAVSKFNMCREINLVFLDCQMPKMDGFGALKEIRRTERGQEVAVVALTANAFREDRQKCMDAGMDDYLAKPVTFNVFEKILSRWVVGKGEQNKNKSSMQTKNMSQIKLDKKIFSELLCLEKMKPGTLVDLMSRFYEGTRKNIQNMQNAVFEGDSVSLRRAAHKLKGSASSFGALELFSMCQKLEDDQISWDQKKSIIHRLPAEVVSYRVQVEREMISI